MTAATRTRGRRGPTLWGYRHVIANFARRDLKAQYQSATLGWLWSLLVPVATVITYSLVFTLVFRAQPPDFGSGRPGIYAVWFLVGLAAWSFVANSISRGMSSLIGAGPMMQKIYLPGYVPVLGTVGAVAVQLFVELGIVLVILAALGNVSPSWLLLPLWLIIALPFAAALSNILAVVNVFVRDLGVAIGVLLQLLFFLTPVLYPLDFVPESAFGLPTRAIVAANPIAQLVIMLRQILYEGVPPALWQFGYVLAWMLVLAALASLLYRRSGRRLGELI